MKTKLALTIFLLIGLGYELNYWLKPTNVKAQETVTTSTPGRFQLVPVGNNGTNTEQWLFDTATGRVFWLGKRPTNGEPVTILEEIPIKSCADTDCKTRKGTKDAR